MEPNKLDGIKHSKVSVEDITSFFWPILFFFPQYVWDWGIEDFVAPNISIFWTVVKTR